MPDGAAPKPVFPPAPLLPAPDVFLLFWAEMLQMPRVLWTCWCDTMVDSMVGMLPKPIAWPEHP